MVLLLQRMVQIYWHCLRKKYYSDDHSDWTYYNSDYYYQCNDTNAALRESAWKMTEKWELGGIDCDEIEANSSLYVRRWF